MREILFASKKDGVYFAAVWMTVAVIAASIGLEFSFDVVSVLWLLFGLLLIGFLLWLWFGTNYHVGEETLTIRNGPLVYRVAMEDIHRIRKVKSVLATPALSVNRLALEYGKYRDIHVSPKNEQEFVRVLLARNPRIEVDEKVLGC
ncbi:MULTISPECIES: PH domain-containing protein [unclassified Sporosarcina]|uniref:PH domain-containing protein n=1 Tax=unclassified Sporosarcina TaxID=2647733 RepID=UPI002041327A|nr:MULTISPECIES: PH domain-containing protein [unclassified Sporosarcina]